MLSEAAHARTESNQCRLRFPCCAPRLSVRSAPGYVRQADAGAARRDPVGRSRLSENRAPQRRVHLVRGGGVHDDHDRRVSGLASRGTRRQQGAACSAIIVESSGIWINSTVPRRIFLTDPNTTRTAKFVLVEESDGTGRRRLPTWQASHSSRENTRRLKYDRFRYYSWRYVDLGVMMALTTVAFVSDTANPRVYRMRGLRSRAPPRPEESALPWKPWGVAGEGISSLARCNFRLSADWLVANTRADRRFLRRRCQASTLVDIAIAINQSVTLCVMEVCWLSTLCRLYAQTSRMTDRSQTRTMARCITSRRPSLKYVVNVSVDCFAFRLPSIWTAMRPWWQAHAQSTRSATRK